MRVGSGGEIFELTIEEGAPIAGLSLIDADSEGLLPQETVIVAIVRDDELHIPRGESNIKAGDTVTVFAKNGASDRITDAFTRT
jgi:trk system potassium uptake protein TrkA